MKKIVFLICSLLALYGFTQAQTTYTFSNYPAGVQYAENEVHVLDEDVTLYTTQCHFTSQIRVYSSNSHNGFFYSSELPLYIESLTFYMGYNDDVVNIYGSTDGSTWSLVGSTPVSSSYSNCTINFGNNNFNYFKFDVAGSNQIRVTSMTINYKSTGPGNVAQMPTFDPAPGVIQTPTDITIACGTNGSSIYYTTDGSTPDNTSTLYTEPIHITQSTTIKAIAYANGYNHSPIATATYLIPVTYPNIAAFKSAFTNTSTQPCLIDNDITVVYSKTINNQTYNQTYTYVKDETAGLLIYETTPNTITNTYQEGDIIEGGIYGTFSLFNDQIEFLPLEDPAPASNNEGAVTPIIITMDELYSNYAQYDAQLVTLEHVSANQAISFGLGLLGDSQSIRQGDNVIHIYNRFYSLDTSFSYGDVFDITGFIGIHNSSIQIQPRGNFDIGTSVPRPALSIIAPEDGANMSTLDTLTIDIDIQNFELGTDGLLKIECPMLAAAGMESPLYLDATSYEYFVGQVLSPLPAGTYTATVSLVGLDSAELSRPVSATTTISIVAPTLPTPAITISGDEADAENTYYFTALVTLTEAQEGAAIHYTTDGTTPDESSPLYTEPFNVTTGCTIQAIATMPYYANSDVATATIIIDTPTVVTPTFNPTAGIYTDSIVVSILCSDEDASIRYTTDSTEPTEESALYEAPITINSTTTLTAKAFKTDWRPSALAEATYTIVNEPILTVSPAALTFNSENLTRELTVSAAYINTPITITCSNAHFTLSQETIAEANGNHIVTVTFDGTEPATGIVTISADTLSLEVTLNATVTLPAPTFTPEDNTADTLISVAIACENADAAIYYTIDGTDPDTNATQYAEPIVLDQVGDYTVKAIAFLNDWDNSAIATAHYNIYRMTVETPVFTPEPNTYDTSITVAITCATENSTIYYTIDGTDPDENATVYNEPINLSDEGIYTIKAMATRNNWNNSEIATAEYTIDITYDIITPSSDTIAYTTGFESDEGFTASTTYNNTSESYTGTEGQQWATYYGTPSTTDPLEGSQSMQMRWYLSSPSNYGYTRMDFDVHHATRIRFKAKSTGNLNAIVSYSTDGGNTYTDSVFAITSNAQDYELVVSRTAAYDIVRFKFSIAEYSGSTNAARLIIDNVNIFNFPNAVAHNTSMPVIAPNAGVVYEPTQVSISCEDSNATIYYTLDGTTPNDSATIYTEPFTVEATTTVKAIAFTEGLNPSNIASATYTFPVEVPNIAAFKAANTTTNNTIYKITGDVTFVFESGSNLFIEDSTAGLLIYDNQNVISNEYTEGDIIKGGVYGSFKLYNGLAEMIPSISMAEASGETTLVTPIMTTIDEVGSNYTQYESRLVQLEQVIFTLGGEFDDHSESQALDIAQEDAEMVVYNNFLSVSMSIPADYEATVIGFISRHNEVIEIIPRNNNDIIGFNDDFDTVATPVITVNPLTNNMVSIELSCATEGATIHYTMDGSTPDTNSETYTGSFIWNNEVFTIKAIAVKQGMTNSPVASYTNDPDGIESFESSFEVYPNPTHRALTLHYAQGNIDQVCLYDIYGKMIRSDMVGDATVTLDLSTLATGTYFLRIHTPEGMVTKKIVKQ